MMREQVTNSCSQRQAFPPLTHVLVYNICRNFANWLFGMMWKIQIILYTCNSHRGSSWLVQIIAAWAYGASWWLHVQHEYILDSILLHEIELVLLHCIRIRTERNNESVRYLPVNWKLSLSLEQFVRPAEVPAPKKPSMGRQPRRVRAGQHMMPFRINQLSLLLRIFPPQHKHHAFPLLVYHSHCVRGKLFPPSLAMACSSMCLDRQHRIQKEHSLSFLSSSSSLLFLLFLSLS